MQKKFENKNINGKAEKNQGPTKKIQLVNLRFDYSFLEKCTKVDLKIIMSRHLAVHKLRIRW